MEDLDPPREVAGAADSILASLQAHGLIWDGDVLWQSQRHQAYAATIQQMLTAGQAFRCDCSRTQLSAGGGIYRGHCRHQPPPPAATCAIRLKVSTDSQVTIADRLQPRLQQDVHQQVGDFVVQRKDGLYAYQLAVVLDDHYQGINQVLRGSDLYDSTPRQVYLQRVLHLPMPIYTHIPVITNDAGHKLSKQTHAAALDDDQALQNLRLALRFLGQPESPECATIDTLLHSAADSWNLHAVPALAGVPESRLY
jgi:glutamyl-Q tRNA(Asp) synthetase